MFNEEGGEILLGMMSSFVSAHRVNRSEFQRMKEAFFTVSSIAKEAKAFREEGYIKSSKFLVVSRHRKIKSDSEEVKETVKFMKKYIRSMTRPHSRYFLKNKTGRRLPVKLLKPGNMPEKFDLMLDKLRTKVSTFWVEKHSSKSWPVSRRDGSSEETHSDYEPPPAPRRRNQPVNIIVLSVLRTKKICVRLSSFDFHRSIFFVRFSS